MKPYLVLFFAWGIAGLGAVVGSVIGNAAGQTGLFLGAFVGGITAVAGAVLVVTKLHRLPRSERAGALIGGVLGFIVAAPIAVGNLHPSIIPVLSCGMVGVGVLLGAGISRGWHRS